MQIEAGKSEVCDAFSSAREADPRADWSDFAIDHSLIEAMIKVEALERLIPWAGPASRPCTPVEEPGSQPRV